MAGGPPQEDWMDRVERLTLPTIAVLIGIVSFVVIPGGSLAIALVAYLKTGVWDVIELSDLWKPPATDWIGFNDVLRISTDLWVGVHSILAGAVAIWLLVILANDGRAPPP